MPKVGGLSGMYRRPYWIHVRELYPRFPVITRVFLPLTSFGNKTSAFLLRSQTQHCSSLTSLDQLHVLIAGVNEVNKQKSTPNATPPGGNRQGPQLFQKRSFTQTINNKFSMLWCEGRGRLRRLYRPLLNRENIEDFIKYFKVV